MLTKDNRQRLEIIIDKLGIDRIDLNDDNLYNISDIETYADYYIDRVSDYFNIKWSDTEHITLDYKIKLLYILYLIYIDKDGMKKIDYLDQYLNIKNNEDDGLIYSWFNSLLNNYLNGFGLEEFSFTLDEDSQYINDELIMIILHTLSSNVTNDLNLLVIKNSLGDDFLEYFLKVSNMTKEEIEEELKNNKSDELLAILYLLDIRVTYAMTINALDIISKVLKEIYIHSDL